jgi:hypothetical protein
MEESPPLDNEYDLYRFIWDDSFLRNLSEGDIFMDKGFISTTRDPFYSPGINGNFGLILQKIKIPKNKKGLGLFMENFSLFPKEEEFLLPPYCKMKLLSKNDNFTYHHTNPEFEKLINRKYEFELIEVDYNSFYKENKIGNKKEIIYHDISKINLNGIDKINFIKNFIKSYSDEHGQINLNCKNKKYSFCFQWFDSSSNSSYEKFYYNKIKDGILFVCYNEDGYPELNIEIGEDMAVNYLNRFYFHNTKKNISIDELDIITELGRIFCFKKVLIYNNFNNFSDLYKDKSVFLYTQHYNHDLYQYLLNGQKFIENLFTTFEIGYWYIDDIFNKQIDNLMKEKIPEDLYNIKFLKNLFIEIVNKYFYLYGKVSELIDRNIIKNSYIIFNIYEKLASEGLTDNFNLNIDYTTEDNFDMDYKLIFRQPLRRI